MWTQRKRFGEFKSRGNQNRREAGECRKRKGKEPLVGLVFGPFGFGNWKFVTVRGLLRAHRRQNQVL
ncbi:unnamed protein product [Dovyalis caffra]|uniref:Uncharacterized protein n=1 Tax=Dovyalis caffra TaxID=77055 RepID=A0AAV1R3U2_9ROSI|nr:unnamed protein product [Dovyalis caffra]